MRPKANVPLKPGISAMSCPPKLRQRRLISAMRFLKAESDRRSNHLISALVWPVSTRSAVVRRLGGKAETKRAGRVSLSPGELSTTASECLAASPPNGVREELKMGASVTALARKFGTSRQTIMRVRDDVS